MDAAGGRQRLAAVSPRYAGADSRRVSRPDALCVSARRRPYARGGKGAGLCLGVGNTEGRIRAEWTAAGLPGIPRPPKRMAVAVPGAAAGANGIAEAA